MNNFHESGFATLQRYRKLKPKPQVTIVIGLICKDRILIGSDSRTTNQDHAVRDNAKKIRYLPMLNNDFAILAHSGDDDLGTRVADRIGILAKNANITDWQTVADIGDKAIVEEMRKLKTPFEGPSRL